MSNQDGGLVGPRLETRCRWVGIYSNQPATWLPHHMGLENKEPRRRRGGVQEGREGGLAFRRRPGVILNVFVSLQLLLMAGSISSLFPICVLTLAAPSPPCLSHVFLYRDCEVLNTNRITKTRLPTKRNQLLGNRQSRCPH